MRMFEYGSAIDFTGWVILGRMCDSLLPKKMLFGWLPQRRTPHGDKLLW